MTAIKKNFANMTTPTPPYDAETEFVRCNFNQDAPDKADPDNPVGVRLWPGDDTPRTFIGCRLINCIVPPGSTVTGPRTVSYIQERQESTDTVTIDGLILSVHYSQKTIYGRYRRNGSVVRFPAPQVHPREALGQ